MKKELEEACRSWLWLGLALMVFSACRVGSDRARKASPFQFVDVTNECQIVSHFGSDFYAWADINQDSFPDVIVTRHRIAPLLFVNQDGRGFRDIFSQTGMRHDIQEPPETSLYLDKHGCAWGDFNNDGELELYIANGAKEGKGIEYNQLYKPEGKAWLDIAETAGVRDPYGRGRNAAWADINNDGFLDLFVANAPREAAPSIFFVNNRDGTFFRCCEFRDINMDGNVYGAWSDFTGDGFMDLTIFSTKNGGTVSLFENNGRCGFKPRGEFSALAFGWADFNGDGALDLVLTNLAGRSLEERRRCPHVLFINDAHGGFQRKIEINSEAALGFGLAIGDFDNDGAPDLYVQNGERNQLFRNKGRLQFQNFGRLVSEEDSWRAAAGNRASSIDFDNDGDLDLFIANSEEKGYSPNQAPEKLHNSLGLFRNESRSNNWLKIRLIGTRSNREGIGAKIILRTRHGPQFREANHGPSGYAQDVLPVHFGLGGASQADEIEIRWPSGVRQGLKNVPARQTCIIKEPAVNVLNPAHRE